MKIAVIIADAAHMIHAGLEVTRTTRVFDMPPEMARYIEANKGQYITVSFATVDEAQGERQ